MTAPAPAVAREGPGVHEIDGLVERHTGPLLRAALAAGLDAAAAEEVVQDVFVAYLEARERFEGRSTVRTFLFGILYNKIRAFRRAAGKEPSLDRLEEAFDARFDPEGHWRADRRPSLDDPAARVEQVELREFLARCLEELPTEHRMAFALREIEGLRTPALCAALEVTANHLGVLLFRARNALRDCLQGKL